MLSGAVHSPQSLRFCGQKQQRPPDSIVLEEPCDVGDKGVAVPAACICAHSREPTPGGRFAAERRMGALSIAGVCVNCESWYKADIYVPVAG